MIEGSGFFPLDINDNRILRPNSSTLFCWLIEIPARFIGDDLCSYNLIINQVVFFRSNPKLTRYVHWLSFQGHGRCEGRLRKRFDDLCKGLLIRSLRAAVLCCNINVEIHDWWWHAREAIVRTREGRSFLESGTEVARWFLTRDSRLPQGRHESDRSRPKSDTLRFSI